MTADVSPSSKLSSSSLTSPANPLLAVSLLPDAELDGIIDSVLDGKPTTTSTGRAKLASGCEELDCEIGGGLRSGDVVGVSGDVMLGTGVVDLCMAFLVSYLVGENETGAAAVLDTTGNFDVMRLYSQILARLKKSHGSDGGDAGVEEKAAGVLARVKIMRVFDLVGVKESIWEIKEGLEVTGEQGRDEMEKEVEQRGMMPADDVAVGDVREKVIADSEGEEDDEEILFQTQDESITPFVVSDDTAAAGMIGDGKDTVQVEGKVGFILMDNFAHVLLPLLKKDAVQANAFASALFRTISHLTQTHSLTTILTNPASVPRTTASPQPKPNNEGKFNIPPHTPHQTQRQPVPPPSVFSSNKAIPALGHILPQVLDLHLLVSEMPRREEDARVMASRGGEQGSGYRRNVRGVEMVSVVEVLADRWGGRVGAWAMMLPEVADGR
ncbi:hypothetical protein BU24DRAFT_416299 [Aaosphaeria arxii CBS 175.79]|uniref:DNA recombination and repair protein Rad51-like C-terminal domain-containing protein n=1 Tax=Aaosphaeria arxii CBS 175.79 TaxID=1450172 RepID=A0A6A5Y6I7_9PLEO|nr:uncharacterized protein BU24DRAFT_416299 [Aaosphaeria arxii CBS 175.79]KAF2020627.1 hypothetical protein BU24DRAFT_416299 [Aaosphaeria arxii CBS 175.79]